MAIKRHKTKLNGGTYGSITISTHVYDGEPYSSMLAAGYAFQYIHTGEFVEYTRKAEYSGVNAISNVKVVKCPHARINEDGHCAYCNADGFAALVTAAADRTTTVYTELAAALAAVQEGSTLTLLEAVSEDTVVIDKAITLDLSGQNIQELQVTVKATLKDSGAAKGTIGTLKVFGDDLTLGDLLEEGYAFKSSGAWVKDLSGKELTNFTTVKVSIKSMEYPTEMTMDYNGVGTILVTVAKETGTGAVSFQWYKVESSQTAAVGSATASNQFDLSAQNLSAGEYTFRFSATCDGYKKTSGDIVVTVRKADVPTSFITAPAAQENLTYTGQEQALVTAGSVKNYGTMQYSLAENVAYIPDIPTATYAGDYTVWYRVAGDANHNDIAPASVAVQIGKKPLRITGVEIAPKSYDGTANVETTGVTLNQGTGYTVTACFDDASVGNGKNVTATVTLMEQAAKNYTLEQGSFAATGNITKAAAPDFTKETALTIVNDYEKTYIVALPALLTLETPKEYGALTYENSEIKLDSGYYTSGAKVENGKLMLSIQKNNVETTGSVGTVTVVIKSSNYEDIILTVSVANKIIPTGAPTLSKTALTYGEKLSAITLSGSLKDGET